MASQLIGGITTAAAVEIDRDARAILFARQRDGHLDRFPIFDDVRNFDGRPWRGYIDLVSGGYPCQAFSEAARGRNTAADLWPEMRRIVEEIRPRLVFAENVTRQPIERTAMELRALGYRVPAIAKVAASAVGAPHIRPRWWVLGDADGNCEPMGAVDAKVAGVSELSESVWPDPTGASFRVFDGVADGLDRRANVIGNGQVPIVAAVAWRLLGGPCLAA